MLGKIIYKKIGKIKLTKIIIKINLHSSYLKFMFDFYFKFIIVLFIKSNLRQYSHGFCHNLLFSIKLSVNTLVRFSCFNFFRICVNQSVIFSS